MLLTGPSVLADIVTSGAEAIKALASGTRAVMFAGAALPVEIGDQLANGGVDLLSGYGS